MKAAKSAARKPTQFDRVSVYEQLALFNQHCEEASALVEVFGKEGMVPRRECRYYRALLQELRALACQSVVEHIDQHEITASAVAERERRKPEKRLISG